MLKVFAVDTKVYGYATGYDGKAETLHLEIYQPSAESASPRPAVVLVHGGGFAYGDKRQALFIQFGRQFAGAGFVAFVINYRLKATDAPFRCAIIDSAVEDITMAIAWIGQHATEYQVNPEKILIAGDSAGGAIAIHTCFRQPEKTRLVGCIDLWGGLPGVSNDLWDGEIYPQDLKPCALPICIIHSTANTVVPYTISLDLANKHMAAGGHCEIHLLDHADHYPEHMADMFIPVMIAFTNMCR